MSSKKFALTAGLAISLFCAGPPARSAPDGPPFVVLPEGNFSCNIQVTPHGADAKPAAPPAGQHYAPVWKEIDITQVGHTRRDLTTWTDESVSQLWSLGGKGISLWQGNGKGRNVYLLRGPDRDQYSPSLLRLDADSLTWITKEALLGDDGGARHYQAKVIVPGAPGALPVTAIYQAWIDPKTLLPVKLDDGNNLYALTFAKEIPTGPLVMPPDIQAELNRWELAMKPHPHIN